MYTDISADCVRGNTQLSHQIVGLAHGNTKLSQQVTTLTKTLSSFLHEQEARALSPWNSGFLNIVTTEADKSFFSMQPDNSDGRMSMDADDVESIDKWYRVYPYNDFVGLHC